MENLAPALVNGVLMGVIYGGIALGLTLMLGVMKIINFAHGSFVMLGMFTTYFVWLLLGLDPYLGFVPTVIVMFVFGYVVQRILLNPLFRRERASVVEPIGVFLLTCGLWLALDNLALMFFGAQFRTARTLTTNAKFMVGDIPVSTPRLIAFVFCLAMAVALYLFLVKTDYGKAIRAVSMNRDAAALVGINVYQVYSVTFALGSAMIGAAAAMILPFYYVDPTVGVVFDLKSFIVIILGGAASIPGALVGGVVLGLVESIGGQFVSGTYAQIAFFVLFILMLVFRPVGLLGKK
ncbi:MAG: branched-chain amino acid ABC transporter permease [Chloroflexota bacterium]